MRVTGGQLGGRRLQVPRGRGVRPSADRVRESLFQRLEILPGTRVLDLYAGTGALGIEALSRGAASAVFVEQAAAALGCLSTNLERLELGERSRVLRSPVASALRRLAREGAEFDLIVLDPPYASGEAERTLGRLAESGLLAPGAVVVLETAWREPPGEVRGLAPVDERRYGETLIRHYRAAQPPVPGAEPGGPDGG